MGFYRLKIANDTLDLIINSKFTIGKWNLKRATIRDLMTTYSPRRGKGPTVKLPGKKSR